jgi:acyl-CoA dehydrogenase
MQKSARHADDMMGLMTPVLKGVLTDLGFANAVNAQQMYGGHGYIAEWGMEQFVRDARIPMIYEGANGIQALDLVGRKLARDGGRAVMAFFAEVGLHQGAPRDEAMKPIIEPLDVSLGHLQAATMWFMNNALTKPDNAGAGASDYMHMFGLVALGYMWAKMAKVAQDKAQGRRQWRDRAHERQARHRPLLHGKRCCRRPPRIWRGSQSGSATDHGAEPRKQF